MTRVLTMGTFDLFHPGHVYLFEQCAKMGKLTVAINTDEFVEKFKGKKPVMSYAERRDIVASCKYVHEVIQNSAGEDAKPAIISVNPDLLVIGSDWAPPRDYHAQLKTTPEWLEENGIALLYLERHTVHSSTDVKSRVMADSTK